MICLHLFVPILLYCFFLCVCLLAYKIWGVPKYVSHSKSSADLMLAQLLMQYLLERKTKNRNHVHYQLMPKSESVGCGFYRKQQNWSELVDHQIIRSSDQQIMRSSDHHHHQIIRSSSLSSDHQGQRRRQHNRHDNSAHTLGGTTWSTIKGICSRYSNGEVLYHDNLEFLKISKSWCFPKHFFNPLVVKLILAVRALNEYGIEQTKVKENKSSDILHGWSSYIPAVKSEKVKKLKWTWYRANKREREQNLRHFAQLVLLSSSSEKWKRKKWKWTR